MEVNDMKIYVLLKRGYFGMRTVIVSEDINKIHTSICTDFDVNKDYPKLEIWEDGKMTYGTFGNDVLMKISEELNALSAYKILNPVNKFRVEKNQNRNLLE